MNNNQSVIPSLLGCKESSIKLRSALEKVASFMTNAIVIVYSPSACQFARVDAEGRLINNQNQPLDLQNIFEARIFTSDYELRWLNQTSGIGQAVLLTEKQVPEVFGESIQPVIAQEITPRKYLLWGEGVNTNMNEGWGTLAEARIGALPVPVNNLRQGQRVYLHSCEYVAIVDDYGNVAVVEERLVELEVK